MQMQIQVQEQNQRSVEVRTDTSTIFIIYDLSALLTFCSPNPSKTPLFLSLYILYSATLSLTEWLVVVWIDRCPLISLGRLP